MPRLAVSVSSTLVLLSLAGLISALAACGDGPSGDNGNGTPLVLATVGPTEAVTTLTPTQTLPTRMPPPPPDRTSTAAMPTPRVSPRVGAVGILPARLSTARYGHTATTLEDGRILIVGGEVDIERVTATAELYDPVAGSMIEAAPPGTGRAWHTATLLPDGNVLIAGGIGPDAASSAEVYDAALGEFLPVGDLAQGRQRHRATSLRDGRVLITGGLSGATPITSAEIYDPATGEFGAAGDMSQRRAQHTATLLSDGAVLIAGGVTARGRRTSEVVRYDPATGAFSFVGNLRSARAYHTATLLGDGRILIVGGDGSPDGNPPLSPMTEVELYDPSSNTTEHAGLILFPRNTHTASNLEDGRVVLVAGEHIGAVSYHAIEIYDPESESWTRGGELIEGRRNHTSTLLPDGGILVIGGWNEQDGALASLEVYEPF